MTQHRGFTLIEVMISLALSALVVLIAHKVFTGVVDGTARLGETRSSLDREANARRLLTEVFGSLDVTSTGSAGFAGHPEQVELTTWLRVPEGWLELRRVVLEAEHGSFVIRGAVSAALRDGVKGVEFDYLLEPGADAVWARKWISQLAAPVAVRVRIMRITDVDTLLFLVGPRG